MPVSKTTSSRIGPKAYLRRPAALTASSHRQPVELRWRWTTTWSTLPDDLFPLDDPPSHPPSTPLLPIRLHLHGAYPSFALDDTMFHALPRSSAPPAHVLRSTRHGAVSRWWTTIGVPSRVRSLAYAPVFWAKVSTSILLLERLRSICDRRWGDDGEYVRLPWMDDRVASTVNKYALITHMKLQFNLYKHKA
jgi:hypothetical protein